jgi:hypothetical protein
MALAYPLTSETGNLVVSTTLTDLYYLFNSAIRTTTDFATLDVQANTIDITAASTTAVNMMSQANGLRSATVSFNGIYPKTSPAANLGTKTLVTFNSGYAAYVSGWKIDISWPEIDITSALGSTGATWRRYMPGGMGSWRGSYTCKADVNTAPTLPASGAAAAAVFQLGEDGTTDPALSGEIIIGSMSQRLRVGDFSEITYNFMGNSDLTQNAGGASLPGMLYSTSSAITKPAWDTTGDGVPDVACVLTAATGRTHSFKAFWTQLSIDAKLDDAIRVSGTLRVTDAITSA